MGIHDVSSVYHVPLLLERQNLVGLLARRLQLSKIPLQPADVERGRTLHRRWQDLTRRYVDYRGI